MKKVLWAVALSGAVGAAAVLVPGAVPRNEPSSAGERVYFALQISDGGRVLASPQLVGDEGKRLTLSLVNPERPGEPRLALELEPARDRDLYRVLVKLSLPGKLDRAVGELALLHGEERFLTLEQEAGPVTVKLLLLRVASPEFETFMDLARRRIAGSAS